MVAECISLPHLHHFTSFSRIVVIFNLYSSFSYSIKCELCRFSLDAFFFRFKFQNKFSTFFPIFQRIYGINLDYNTEQAGLTSFHGKSVFAFFFEFHRVHIFRLWRRKTLEIFHFRLWWKKFQYLIVIKTFESGINAEIQRNFWRNANSLKQKCPHRAQSFN